MASDEVQENKRERKGHKVGRNCFMFSGA